MIATQETMGAPQTTHTFGARLRALRKARGIGLQTLADVTGIDTSALSKIENGHRRPPELGTLARVAIALGLVEGESDFKYLWALAERERNPAQARYAEKVFSDLLHLEGVTVAERRGANDLRAPVYCRSFAELVSKSIAEAIATQAWEITVKSSSGGETKYLLFSGHGLETARDNHQSQLTIDACRIDETKSSAL